MTKVEVTTETDLAPDLVWAAIIDFTEDRLRLWPFIEPSLFKVHSVEPGRVDAQEGSKSPLGRVWARERYEWDDATQEMRATVLESNIFAPGGTAVFEVVPRDGGGTVLRESYDRERLGWRGKVMDVVMSPARLPTFIGKGRSLTYDAIRERPAAGAG